jgi:hypothetical protein
LSFPQTLIDQSGGLGVLGFQVADAGQGEINVKDGGPHDAEGYQEQNKDELFHLRHSSMNPLSPYPNKKSLFYSG